MKKFFVVFLLFSFSFLVAAFPQPKNDYRDSASASFFKEADKQTEKFLGSRSTFDPATKILLVLLLLGVSFAAGVYYTRHHHPGGAQ